MFEKVLVDVLMADGCTGKEALKHLNNGAIIYPVTDIERKEYVDAFIQTLPDPEDKESKLIAEDAWEGLPTVEVNGESYKIEYVL